MSSVFCQWQAEAESDLLHPEVPSGERQLISVSTCLFPLTVGKA